MANFLRKLVEGSMRWVRVGGRNAREACRTRCCTPNDQYVRVIDCCFPTSVQWLNIRATCANGSPVWTQGGRPQLFVGPGRRIDGTLVCNITDPPTVRTRAAIVATDPNATFLEGPPGPCQEGTCLSAPCACPACCAHGDMNPCGPEGPGAGTCCECGSDFRFEMIVRYTATESKQVWNGFGGDLTAVCPGGNRQDCRIPLSGPIQTFSQNFNSDIKIDYHCGADGNLNPECVGWLSRDGATLPTYTYPVWYLESLQGVSPTQCPDPDGWLPHRDSDNASGCDVFTCAGSPCLIPPVYQSYQVCGMDRGRIIALAAGIARFMLATTEFDASILGLTYPIPQPTANADQLINGACSGHLVYNGPPYSEACPGHPVPGPPHVDWNWHNRMDCKGGTINETYAWNNIIRFATAGGGYYSGRISLSIVWKITQNAACVTHPCLPPRPYVPNAIYMDGQTVRADDFL